MANYSGVSLYNSNPFYKRLVDAGFNELNSILDSQDSNRWRKLSFEAKNTRIAYPTGFNTILNTCIALCQSRQFNSGFAGQCATDLIYSLDWKEKEKLALMYESDGWLINAIGLYPILYDIKDKRKKQERDMQRAAASSSSNNYNSQPAPKLSLAEQIAIERERRRKQAEWEAAWKSRFETAGKVIKWLFNKFLDLGKFIGSKLR